METKRFIGNDMPRLYERIRREIGPDAVIVRTRSLLRDGAEPLIEVLASAPQAQPEVSLDLQWQMIDGALGRLQISRPSATIGDLEDMVARDADIPALASPGLVSGHGTASPEGPDWMQGYVDNAPRGPVVARRAHAAEFDDEHLPAPGQGPAPFQPRPRPSIVREDAAPPMMPPKPRRPDPATGTEAVYETLVGHGFSESAAERILLEAPGVMDARDALVATLEGREVLYPDEGRTALITMAGPVGAGRTTALVRMALDCADARRDAILLAADSTHVGARAQLHAYGEAIGIDVVDAFDTQDVIRELSKRKRGVCVFADVPAGEWRAPALPGVEVLNYLVLPAHWQPQALQATVAGAAQGGFAGAVVSFTETVTDLTPVVSLVVDSRLGLAFLSSGRDVSTGIAVADPLTLASGIFTTSTGERTDGRLVASA